MPAFCLSVPVNAVRCWLVSYNDCKESGPEIKGVNHFDVTYALSAYDQEGESFQHLAQSLNVVLVKKAKCQGRKDPGMKDFGADRE